MNDERWSDGPLVPFDARAERRGLASAAVGLPLLGAGLWFTGAAPAVFAVPLALGVVAAAGRLAYATCGRDVYVGIALCGVLVRRAVSRVVVELLYALAVVPLGLVLRLLGMNRLERSFEQCRREPSMFRPAPDAPRDSYWRQS